MQLTALQSTFQGFPFVGRPLYLSERTCAAVEDVVRAWQPSGRCQREGGCSPQSIAVILFGDRSDRHWSQWAVHLEVIRVQSNMTTGHTTPAADGLGPPDLLPAEMDDVTEQKSHLHTTQEVIKGGACKLFLPHSPKTALLPQSLCSGIRLCLSWGSLMSAGPAAGVPQAIY